MHMTPEVIKSTALVAWLAVNALARYLERLLQARATESGEPVDVDQITLEKLGEEGYL
ncbi:MAG TPA: hypothetical protein VM221_11285 [Armatimonadota bacterium]|nr:hypothetical protein [Armatimonadota bacterium]